MSLVSFGEVLADSRLEVDDVVDRLARGVSTGDDGGRVQHLATACVDALLQLQVFCPRLHERSAPIEHVGALVCTLDAF